ARAYGMPTLDEYGRHRALSQASESGDTASTNHSTCTSKEPAEPPRPNGGQ
ncbi:1-acyl-sn-glycerol-3-phosphate acyltransferase, partial [Xanthomonas citri pv. citri]|nr:1-acyl-sn-glycerol-3-phosphate acyltransferase [Xanthomonas citri pv. citri]